MFPSSGSHSPSGSGSHTGSHAGSIASEKSMFGAEMLFNEDYLKKNAGSSHKHSSDEEGSELSLPLSRHSSRKSGHSKKSGSSHKKRYNDIYSLGFDEGSSSRSRSAGSSGHKHTKHRDFDEGSESSASSRSSISSRSSASSRYSKESSKSSSIIVPKKKKMSADDILRRKQELLFELDRMEIKGRSYFRKLTLASSLEEIEGAHERLQLDMELDDAIASLRKLLISVVTIIEKVTETSLFQRYSPIKPRLSGWSQSVSLEIESYDNVFKRLYIKHRSKTLVNEEMQLFFMITMSGITFHITSLAASKFPGVNDILKKDPTLFPKFMNFVNQSGMGMGMNSGGPDTMPSSYAQAPPQYAQQQAQPQPMGGGGGGGFSFPDLFKVGMDLFGGMMKPSPAPQNQGGQMPMSQNMPQPQQVRPQVRPQAQQASRSVNPQMPMPQQPQMKGPGNIEDILRSIEENRLDSASNASETEFSEIPDDVSISGAISKKPKRIIKRT